MYNVRLIKYPAGYQVRLYSEPFGAKFEDDDDFNELMFGERKIGNDLVDGFTGEILASDFFVRKDFDTDVWIDLDSDVTFESVPDFLAAQAEAEREKKRSESLRVSVTRTRNNLYYISRSNKWDWFITLTLSPQKVDRFDYEAVSKKVRKCFNNVRNRKCPELMYLIVPELHEDGAWHVHGLLANAEGLEFFDTGLFDKQGRRIFNIKEFEKALGWTTATVIGATEKASSYVCKYITKEMCASSKGRQRYWVSNNCARAEVLEGYMNAVQLRQFRQRLMDNMLWKKKHLTEFTDVEYFEIPADDSILD